MTTDEALSAAWTKLAPNRDQNAMFPRGFWPDLARVALEIYGKQTTDIVLDFRPTMCERGSFPETTVKRKSSLGLDLNKLEISL